MEHENLDHLVGMSGKVVPAETDLFKEFRGTCIHVYEGLLQVRRENGDVYLSVEPSQFTPEYPAPEGIAKDKPAGIPNRVVVTVRGGVADVTECPPDCIVEIRDYDTDGCGPEQLEADGSVCAVIHGPVSSDKIAQFTEDAKQELMDDGMAPDLAEEIAAGAGQIIREHLK